MVVTGLSLVPTFVRKTSTAPAVLAASLCAQHGDDLPGRRDEVEAECSQWLMQWRQESATLPDSEIPDSPLEYVALEQVKQGMYPNVQTVLQLIATLPVVAVECERNVSALQRLKNFMRNTTGQDRLSNSASMHVHYGHPVDVQKVGDIFAACHPNEWPWPIS